MVGAFAAGFASAVLLGVVGGWQLRGFLESRRRGGDVNLVGARRR